MTITFHNVAITFDVGTLQESYGEVALTLSPAMPYPHFTRF
jgi:hypothetical protein